MCECLLCLFMSSLLILHRISRRALLYTDPRRALPTTGKKCYSEPNQATISLIWLPHGKEKVSTYRSHGPQWRGRCPRNTRGSKKLFTLPVYPSHARKKYRSHDARCITACDIC